MTDVVVYPACLRDVFEAIATESLQCGLHETCDSQIVADNQSLLKMLDASAPDNKIDLAPLGEEHPNTTFYTTFTNKAFVPPANAPYDVVFTISRVADFMAPARIVDEAGNDVSDSVAAIRFCTTSDTDPLITFDSMIEARRFVLPILALGGSRTLRMEVSLVDKNVRASPELALLVEMHAYFVTAAIRDRVMHDYLSSRVFRLWPTGDGRTLVTLGDQWLVTKPWCAKQ